MLRIGLFIATLVVFTKPPTTFARVSNSNSHVVQYHQQNTWKQKQPETFLNWKLENVTCNILQTLTTDNLAMFIPSLIRESYSTRFSTDSPRKFDQVAHYISNICDPYSAALGWTTVLQELNSTGKMYSEETLKLAYFVSKDINKHWNGFFVNKDGKQAVNMYNDILLQLPKNIAQLFWQGKKCAIKNLNSQDYLLHFSDPPAPHLPGLPPPVQFPGIQTPGNLKDSGKYWTIDRPVLVHNDQAKSSTVQFSISYNRKPSPTTRNRNEEHRYRQYLCVRRRPLPIPFPAHFPAFLTYALEPFHPKVRVCASDTPVFPLNMELQAKWIFTPVITARQEEGFKLHPEGDGLGLWSKAYLYMGHPTPFFSGRPVLAQAGALMKKESDWEVMCE